MLVNCTINPPPPQIASSISKIPEKSVNNKNTLVIGVDDIGTGFNPHLHSNLSPINLAIANLTLPRVFNRKYDKKKFISYELNKNLVSSATVTSLHPFTVTYKIIKEAQWSDGVPVVADNFYYLWKQMISNANVIDPAGYKYIKTIEARHEAKEVRVIFYQPYWWWKSLFNNILPSHVFKTLPGGFASGLDVGLKMPIPVAAAPFVMKSFDSDRGEIILVRNDRFWGTPSRLAKIIFRRINDVGQLAQSLRSNNFQMAILHGNQYTKAQLSAIPNIRVKTISQSRIATLIANTRSVVLQEEKLRKAIFGLLNIQLTAISGYNGAFWLPVNSILLSNQKGREFVEDLNYKQIKPQIWEMLRDAGYKPGFQPDFPAIVNDNGIKLSLNIGVNKEDSHLLAAAHNISDQFNNFGIKAKVVHLSHLDFFSRNLTEKNIDLILGWQYINPVSSNAYISRYTCGLFPSDRKNNKINSLYKKADLLTNLSNLTAFCDKGFNDLASQLLIKTSDTFSILAVAEKLLREKALVIPIFQDATLVAVSVSLRGIKLNSVYTGEDLFFNIYNWNMD